MLGAYAQATISATARARPRRRWFDLTPTTALSAAIVTVLVALTAVQLVLGELVPKALALQYPTETALATVLPMRWSLVVFRPFIARAQRHGAPAPARCSAPREQAHRHLHSPEEIDLLIAESRDGGLLEPEEQQRLRRALHLGRRHGARSDGAARSADDAARRRAVGRRRCRRSTASPFSRLPVYRGSPRSRSSACCA